MRCVCIISYMSIIVFVCAWNSEFGSDDGKDAGLPPEYDHMYVREGLEELEQVSLPDVYT